MSYFCTTSYTRKVKLVLYLEKNEIIVKNVAHIILQVTFDSHFFASMREHKESFLITKKVMKFGRWHNRFTGFSCDFTTHMGTVK